jgi:hypothetical protein
LSNYLTKMKQKIKTIWKCHNIKEIDQIMVDKVYLWLVYGQYTSTCKLGANWDGEK